MTIGDARPVEAARIVLGLSVEQLWVAYFGLGGSLLIPELARFLEGKDAITTRDYNLVQALNEQFLERGDDPPVPFADEGPEPAS